MGSFVISNSKLPKAEKSKELLVSKGHHEVYEKLDDNYHLLYTKKNISQKQ